MPAGWQPYRRSFSRLGTGSGRAESRCGGKLTNPEMPDPGTGPLGPGQPGA
jgi:hypothetical protein